MRRWPKERWTPGDYDTLVGGFKKRKFCFITTATCQNEGKPDDCAELTAFRAFRDGWLTEHDGAALIERYYDVAPGIVACLDLCGDADEGYAEVRRRWLAPCYEALREGRYADCRADLLTLLHADPQNESALLLEALTLQHMGQPTEAINKLNLIVAAYPQSADALATRASVLYGMKRYALARADYDRLVSMQPREAEWLVERARCLVALGEKTAARRDLDKAVQLGTPQGVVQALYNLTR